MAKGRSRTQLALRLEELREGLAHDPAALRSSVADLVRDVAGAQVGVWYRFGLVDGEPYPVEWAIHGAPETLLSRQSVKKIPWPAGDPRLPDASCNGRFRDLRSMLPLDSFLQTRFYEECFAPAGIHDQTRMMLYHRGTHVAWIGALRVRGEPPFSSAELRRVRSLTGPITDALVHAHATAHAASPEEGADLVVDALGRVELWSESAASVLAHPEHQAMLAQWARAVDRGESPPRLLAGHRVRWARLHSANGTRWLLHLEPIEPLRLLPGFELSRTQRTVAELAAAGALVREIAEELSISPSTVRTHLRVAYETLGVANRVELARALAPSPTSTAIRRRVEGERARQPAQPRS